MANEYIRVFRAFTDENRVRVLEMLCEGEQCACFLLDDLKISQPTLSYHMKVLCDSGIVKSRPVGKWNYYSINTDGCDYASHLLNTVVNRNMEPTLRVTSFVHRCLRPVRALRLKTTPGINDACTCYCIPQLIIKE
ncbi:MAG: metalloregulator ArsR/SmtB family transcription factor [Syntrophomonadaceae bacterium]|nr:metalloregulator ArsR/SmtB family transcription factor [Syntrophomonadaceae bacterium]